MAAAPAKKKATKKKAKRRRRVKPIQRKVTVKKRRRVGFKSKGQYWFDTKTAAASVEFIERFCTHVKGEWAGQKLVLDDWEKYIIQELFGWKNKDHKDPRLCTRQYRTLWLEVPRKNGKSLLCAAIALLLLFWDKEPGAEIFSAAADREQAAIIFDMAKTMRENEPELFRRSETYGGTGGQKRQILKGNSFYRVLSADAYTKHGLNAHGILVDEVHAQKTRDLIDTLKTSVGARRQPIEIYITTAGDNQESICWELHEYAERVIEGSFDPRHGVTDPTFLPFIYGANQDDDYTDPRVWAFANPGLGKSPKLEYIRKECKEAQAKPAYENTFRRVHLNQWTEQAQRWIQMRAWDQCKGQGKRIKLEKYQCWAGLDLASTTDVAAFVAAFKIPGEIKIVNNRRLFIGAAMRHGSDKIEAEAAWLQFSEANKVPETQEMEMYTAALDCRFWIPGDTLQERIQRKDKVPWDVWQKAGLVTVTDGNVIDYDFIRAEIGQYGIGHDVQEIAIDRWNATQITTQLEGDGFTVVPFGQGFASMSAPSKEFEMLILSKRLVHYDHPILRWMARNVAAKTDASKNIKPDKEKSREKIDGIVAAIMAIGRMIATKGPAKSVYEERGIRSIG